MNKLSFLKGTSVFLFLFMSLCFSSHASEFEHKFLLSSGGDSSNRFGSAVAITPDSSRVVITQTWWHGILVYGDDVVYVYENNNGAWDRSFLTANNLSLNSRFGSAVDITPDGETIIVSAPYQNNQGAVYLFTFNGTSWDQTHVFTASDGSPSDNYGNSIAVADDGLSLIIGAYREDETSVDENFGAAYHYEFNGTSWDETKITASDRGFEGAFFGSSVAISNDGELLLVGAEGARDLSQTFPINDGQVYIYERDQSAWNETILRSVAPSDRFGSDVDISDDKNTIAVGAPAGSARVFIFRKDADVWVEEFIEPYPDTAHSNFGGRIDLSPDGNELLVGADDIGINPIHEPIGVSTLFRYSGSHWDEQILLNEDGLTEDLVVGDVAMSENYLLSGAVKHPNGGAAYLFNHNFELNVSDLTPGESVTLTLTGAEPGENVFFERGSVGGPQCPPLLGGHCINMTSRIHMNVIEADASGTAELTATLPANVPAGRVVVFQAVAIRGSGGINSMISNPVTKVVN